MKDMHMYTGDFILDGKTMTLRQSMDHLQKNIGFSKSEAAAYLKNLDKEPKPIYKNGARTN